jgi:hypothetical protein
MARVAKASSTSTVETHREHLAFLEADGSLAALVLNEIVEEWFEGLA